MARTVRNNPPRPAPRDHQQHRSRENNARRASSATASSETERSPTTARQRRDARTDTFESDAAASPGASGGQASRAAPPAPHAPHAPAQPLAAGQADGVSPRRNRRAMQAARRERRDQRRMHQEMVSELTLDMASTSTGRGQRRARNRHATQGVGRWNGDLTFRIDIGADSQSDGEPEGMRGFRHMRDSLFESARDDFMAAIDREVAAHMKCSIGAVRAVMEEVMQRSDAGPGLVPDDVTSFMGRGVYATPAIALARTLPTLCLRHGEGCGMRLFDERQMTPSPTRHRRVLASLYDACTRLCDTEQSPALVGRMRARVAELVRHIDEDTRPEEPALNDVMREVFNAVHAVKGATLAAVMGQAFRAL